MPFVGEITIFAGNFPPVGWFFCQGQLLPISEYSVLFNLIGTTYGGDGQSTFALPDLRGRIPLHQGTNNGETFDIGQMGGTEQVTLTVQQIASHAHSINANNSGGTTDVPGYSAVDPFGNQIYSDTANANMIQSGLTGGNLPHDNLPPFLCVNFIIAYDGIYPTQN